MRISDWSSDVCSSDLKAGISPVVSSQDEGPEYRVEDIEDTVGHPPCAVRDAIGGFFRKRRHQNEQKRRPCRERTPGRDPGARNRMTMPPCTCSRLSGAPVLMPSAALSGR